MCELLAETVGVALFVFSHFIESDPKCFQRNLKGRDLILRHDTHIQLLTSLNNNRVIIVPGNKNRTLGDSETLDKVQAGRLVGT